MRFPMTLLAAALVSTAPLAYAQTTGESACTALSTFAVSGLRLEITKTQWMPSGPAPTAPGAPQPAFMLPAYCRVDGVIDRRTGVDGKSYGIGFAVALPDDWNGRFLFQGAAA